MVNDLHAIAALADAAQPDHTLDRYVDVLVEDADGNVIAEGQYDPDSSKMRTLFAQAAGKLTAAGYFVTTSRTGG